MRTFEEVVAKHAERHPDGVHEDCVGYAVALEIVAMLREEMDRYSKMSVKRALLYEQAAAIEKWAGVKP